MVNFCNRVKKFFQNSMLLVLVTCAPSIFADDAHATIILNNHSSSDYTLTSYSIIPISGNIYGEFSTPPETVLPAKSSQTILVHMWNIPGSNNFSFSALFAYQAGSNHVPVNLSLSFNGNTPVIPGVIVSPATSQPYVNSSTRLGAPNLPAEITIDLYTPQEGVIYKFSTTQYSVSDLKIMAGEIMGSLKKTGHTVPSCSVDTDDTAKKNILTCTYPDFSV